MTYLILILLALALSALGYASFKWWRTDRALQASRSDAAAAAARAQSLAKYQSIADAEAEAERVVRSAQAKAATVMADAEAEADRGLRSAQAKAKAVLSDAETARSRAESFLNSAGEEAAKTIEGAKKRAAEIAGEAYTAMEKMKDLEHTARALKNVIEGYGDDYVVPTQALLDQLAEQYGFDEAGQKLKTARERIRKMIKDGTAAECDYVEDYRKRTAITFVIDAFNGKVDSILADVREDNAGTLEQKINDAFQLVNHNGSAFRNARITANYLQARIDELRWAVAVQELKARDREEQRLLRERIREEERAQREFEKARKEAEKEEEILRKAMEKVQREFDKAGEAQKAKYEDQLQELSARLREAEEKNQRALSMAQQTKAGHVYVISNVGSFGEHVYKIGLTRRLEPLDRIRELGDASVPFEFDVHALIKANDAPALERELHKRFVRQQVNKVNPRKEFFRTHIHDIRAVVDGMGCKAQWTLSAECREFKETQALERQMSADQRAETEWVRHQLDEKTLVHSIDADPSDSAA